MHKPIPKLLFVDRDRARLDRIERALAAYDGQWVMCFCESVSEARESLEEDGADLLVIDTTGAEANALELLDTTRRVSPQTIRIAISSQVDEELTLESLHATHRFLARPLGDADLEGAIVDALSLRDTLRQEALVRTIGTLRSVPALPAIYDELMAEMASESGTVVRMGQIIERDMGLSVTLLKVVNSAFYGLFRHVESPSQAATLLGAEVMKNMAMSEKLFSQFRDESLPLERLAELNLSANITGVLCHRCARVANLSGRATDHAQVAGLLSRLGDLIVEARLTDVATLAEYGVTPESVAAYILESWAMPDPITLAVARQLESRPAAVDGALTPRDVLAAVRFLQDALPSTRLPTQEQIDDAQLRLTHRVPARHAADWMAIYLEWLAQDLALAA